MREVGCGEIRAIEIGLDHKAVMEERRVHVPRRKNPRGGCGN